MFNRRVFLKGLVGFVPVLIGSLLTAAAKEEASNVPKENAAKKEHLIIAQLREIWLQWDPLGVMSSGCPRDEYDSYLEPTLYYLESGVPTIEIEHYLTWVTSIWMGYQVSAREVHQFAVHLQEWYATRWGSGKAIQFASQKNII